MSGRTTQALDHLRRSVASGERFRELARTDTDFDPIRDRPEFAEIVS